MQRMSTPAARDTVRNLPTSLIREIANANMHRSDLIALWFGESDTPTDPVITQAGIESLGRGETFYSPNLGLGELRTAIADYQRHHFGGSATSDNVVVTNSGLNAILLAVSALISPGNEAIVLTPGWPNIAAIPAILGATVREVQLRIVDGRFRLNLHELIDAITPRTRIVLLNSPHNPTGWMLPQDDVVQLAAELDRRGVWLIADEVYGRLVYDAPTASSFLTEFDDHRRLLVINSFSKTWAMTGWRLGWITAPASLVPEFEKLVEFNASCAPVFVQRAGIAAIRQGEPFVAAQRERLLAARTVVHDMLGGHPAIALPAMDAAFYAFPRLLEGDVRRFVEAALTAGVGLAPGAAFGAIGSQHFRLCYARSPEVVRDACRKLVAILDGPVQDG